MATKRRNILILVSAIGLPTLVAIGLFGFGLSIGDEHRAEVIDFEERFLGMSAPENVGAPNVPPPPTLPRANVAPTPPPTLPPPTQPPPEPERPPIDAGTAKPGTDAAVPASALVGEAPPNVPGAVAPLAPISPIPPVGDVPAVTVAVRIKVLVDERYVRAEPRWLSVVQQTVAEASRAYQQRVGIELVLQGIVRWPRALEGMPAPGLLADLQSHQREGADILIGVLGVPLEPVARATAAPAPSGPRNGAYAVAGVGAQTELPHLRGVLWGVGRLLGARPLSADAADEVSLGSWMGDGPSPADGRPWLDLENIQRIHARRGHPFEAPTDAAIGGGAKAARRLP